MQVVKHRFTFIAVAMLILFCISQTNPLKQIQFFQSLKHKSDSVIDGKIRREQHFSVVLTMVSLQRPDFGISRV